MSLRRVKKQRCVHCCAHHQELVVDTHVSIMSNNNPIVLNFQESLLRLSDIELLAGPCWLNDTVISFYFEYLESRQFKNNPMLLFVPPQVTQCIKVMEASEVGIFLEPLDSRTRDFIFFALNDNEQADMSGGTHWSLLVFSFPDRKCFHFDSSQGTNSLQAQELGSKVLHYLNIRSSYNDAIIEVNCLQQSNGYDCGIHVLAMCEHLAHFALCCRRISDAPLLDREIVVNKRHDILNLINYLRHANTGETTYVR